MKNFLGDLSSRRGDMQSLESQRSMLSKEISLVRDLEALGSAMSSHPLNTLSHRYAIYKKKRNDVVMIKNILMEKAVESERMMEHYLNFIDDARCDKINSSLIDIKSNYAAVTASEFELIKEFLEGSNQGQTYQQGETLRTELDVSVMQEQKTVAAAFEALVQYFNIVKFYPHEHVNSHRFAKYSQWCRSLIINKSQEFVRQVAITYHSTFGDAALKEQVPDNIIGFNFRLQTFLGELNYQREISHQCYSLKLAENQGTRTFNVIKEEFRNFIHNQVKATAGDSTFSACALTKMLKRLLAIEMSTFSTPGEHLPDLIINERWYIDEFKIQMSFLSNINEVVVDCASPRKNSLLGNSLECFKSVTESLETFNRIKNDFQLRVIPQTLKGIISGDKTVLEMISTLSNLQGVTPLTELATKLQEDLHSCIHNPNQNPMMRAADLSEAYKNMVAQYEAMTVDCMGKKIFLALNAMFVEMTKVSKKVLSFDKTLNILPDDWSDLAELQQAKNLFISPMKTTICMTLEQVFLVKRIQTMIEFFSCCLQIAWAFKGSGVPVNFDSEFLTRPLKAYISECLMKYVLGRGSHSLSIIICSIMGHKVSDVKCFSFDQMCSMATINTKFCDKYFIALEEQFRTEEAAGHFKTTTRKQTEYGKHLTHVLSAHHWLHEDYIIAHPTAMPPVPRAALLLQLQTFIQSLNNWNSSIHKINEELKQCTVVVLQRLKWASGANPMVNELMKSFESISNANIVKLVKTQEFAATALKHCCSILNYEMLRFKTPKALISDEEFLNFLQQWENVCVAERNVAHTVNPIEEALVELLDPEGKIERAWINNVTSLIDDMINQVHSDIDSNEKRMTAARDNLDLSAHKLRSFIASHHRISADIRNLLKSILKHDDSDQNKALKEYLARYKTFIDNVTELHGNVLSKDFTDVMVKRTIEQVDGSLTMINEIYNDLFTFEKKLSTTLTDGGQRRLLRNQSENFSIEYPGSPIKKGQFGVVWPCRHCGELG